MGIRQNFTNAIRIYKEQHNLSLCEFSGALEVSRSTIQEYLDGRGNPSLSMIELIAEKMDMDPRVLISGEFEPGQLGLLLYLLRSFKTVDTLTPEKQRQLGILFIEIVSLLDPKEMNMSEDELRYRRPLRVREVVRYAREGLYPRCPQCRGILDREYMCYCNMCGQCLDWTGYGKKFHS